MVTPRRRAALFMILAFAAGCASTGRPVEEGTSEDVEVTVENQNYNDAVIYAIWGAGPRDRLGMVTGNTTQTFTTAVRGGGDMRLEVDLIAGNDVATHSMGVYEGDQVELVIPPTF
ncbi:MAG: hypothetical protein AB7T31_16790 [Gemmatimonadales bacterium]